VRFPRSRFYAAAVELELDPSQPAEVEAAIGAEVLPPPARPDPWWQAGIDEALYGEATARPRNTLGADLA
jgi:hypothetical protein